MTKVQRQWKDFLKNKDLIVLGLPGILFLLIFSYLPMAGIVIAFKEFNYDLGIWKSPWNGLKNFEFFFTSESALRVTRNTLGLNLTFIVTGTIAAVVLALMLYEMSRRAVKIYQTILFFPFFISWVVVSYAVYALLNTDFGAINTILKQMGRQEIMWYSETKFWFVIMVCANIWKYVGYYALLFYTGLLGIDSTYYEAAEIDGATKAQQIRHISIPLITPLIIMLTLLSIGRIFYSDFGMFYFLPRDSSALYPVTDVIDTYVYRALRNTGEIGMAAASGFYQSMVGFVLILCSNLIVKKINPENAIF